MSDTFSVRLFFECFPQSTEFSITLVKNVEIEKYAEFRVHLAMLSMIGFLYPIKLVPPHTIESLDLTYWYKLIYTKLNLSKPIKPRIHIDGTVDIISPVRIEVIGVGDTFYL
jgi:hypothetical protein